MFVHRSLFAGVRTERFCNVLSSSKIRELDVRGPFRGRLLEGVGEGDEVFDTEAFWAEVEDGLAEEGEDLLLIPAFA